MSAVELGFTPQKGVLGGDRFDHTGATELRLDDTADVGAAPVVASRCRLIVNELYAGLGIHPRLAEAPITV
jgi:hypothetical protein